MGGDQTKCTEIISALDNVNSDWNLIEWLCFLASDLWLQSIPLTFITVLLHKAFLAFDREYSCREWEYEK